MDKGNYCVVCVESYFFNKQKRRFRIYKNIEDKNVCI